MDPYPPALSGIPQSSNRQGGADLHPCRECREGGVEQGVVLAPFLPCPSMEGQGAASRPHLPQGNSEEREVCPGQWLGWLERPPVH